MSTAPVSIRYKRGRGYLGGREGEPVATAKLIRTREQVLHGQLVQVKVYGPIEIHLEYRKRKSQPLQFGRNAR